MLSFVIFVSIRVIRGVFLHKTHRLLQRFHTQPFDHPPDAFVRFGVGLEPLDRARDDLPGARP